MLYMSKSACASWDFRANEEYYDIGALKKWLRENAKYWVFQLEQGDGGYKHWQGRFSLRKKRYRPELLKLFNETGLKEPNFWQPTIKDEAKSKSFSYVLKADTRLLGPFKDTDPSEQPTADYIPSHLRNLTLKEWQQFVIDSKKKRNLRKINLIFDPVGNRGKSVVASVAELYHGGIDMPPINDFKEMVALLCNICMDTNVRDPGLIFIDMPRAQRKDQLFGLYSAIEQIKKGKLYDTRHHYKCWWIEVPEIWVFSNTLPDMEYLSFDRWKLWEFTPDGEQLIALDLSSKQSNDSISLEDI